MQSFRANGKLLLSGEYVILDGAKGLALPTKQGQAMNISPAPDKNIHWTAFDHKNVVWFECVLSDAFEIIRSSNQREVEMLVKILALAKNLSPDNNWSAIAVETHLEFPADWGLGSSSTLISLVAQYGQCDPYVLLERTFGGSGYDIACATADQPIIYQKTPQGRAIQKVNFDPPFKDQLYFLHLGKKQDSRAGIQYYNKTVVDKSGLIEEISYITEKLLLAAELDEFCYYVDLHEVLIANALHIKKVKESHFPDFPGSVKSLGAWGGDFVCVASLEDEEMIRLYFSDKGFFTLLKYSEIILL